MLDIRCGSILSRGVPPTISLEQSSRLIIISHQQVIDSNRPELTVALITRSWMHSTYVPDHCIFYDTMSRLYSLGVNGARLGHSNAYIPPRVIRAIAKGAAYGSSPDCAFERFIENAAQGLRLIPEPQASRAADSLYDLLSAFPMIDERNEYLRALIKSETLWKTLFELLLESITESQKENAVSFYFVSSLDFANVVLSAPTTADLAQKEIRPHAILLASSSTLWDALDVLLAMHASVTSVTSMCRLIYIPNRMMFDYTYFIVSTMLLYEQIHALICKHPSLASRLKLQLPRPRSLRALFDASFSAPGHPAPPKIITKTMVTPHEERFEEEINSVAFCGLKAWVLLERLQQACGVHRQCMRRGCSERWTSRCKACRTTQYCGRECQRS